MRTFILLLASFLNLALGFVCAPAQAQAYASNAELATANTDNNDPTTGAATTEKMVLVGKITNPAGPLPGAVVILTATKQMAVTNADGEFEFTVPANAGALQAVVTYAGYADEKMTLNASAEESTVNLANAKVIVVSRKQQLKKYLKTARKQINRDLRQVRAK
ncbi:carboxypeptidase-like regulatory domain-containing protein [Hymenobacter sp. 5317J-9]|uniref:carboxypeptidase-like regulatory domain-containing protein n=1 Tax=Hymenobacter sp. 5317J-9 TaxID=2932250 RepID=UPI001FD6BBB1|nr:carboxypeptidase-like regulatory domain-containing protein [Hymenobacter sp. 5317J-9]UOQ97401.1 carboxypeptidase-like regulatory domain-containing protein [Hymenobacter sp. 5317J-9]